MNTQQAYNLWAAQYDTNVNLTRDLEGTALRETLRNKSFQHVLEIGCGTGKNTVWLAERTVQLTAVDFSGEMLAKARGKQGLENVSFCRADITEAWNFGPALFDLISFSLVLEHIQSLEPVFEKAATALRPGGFIYIGELHPFRQYSGSKARFQTEEGMQVVDCHTHHLSDFFAAATTAGLLPGEIAEYFDDEDRTGIPRILSVLFKKR